MRLKQKGVSSFSCSHCELFLPITMLNDMYWNDEQIIQLVLKSQTTKNGLTGEQRLEKLRKNPHHCFCCGYKFSKALKGAYVAQKRDRLEEMKIIVRIDNRIETNNVIV